MIEADDLLRAPALEAARAAAFPHGEFVGQESFMAAGEIRELAERASVSPAARVLDLCCGMGGPGRLVTAASGCSYLGVDASASAIRIARERAADLPSEFRVMRVPPLPAGRFDVVLLLETMLAFPDKRPLLEAVAEALHPGGRFACTLEAGSPLTEEERAGMPGGDTVWPIPLEAMRGELERVGLPVVWQRDATAQHRETAAALVRAYEQAAPAIRREIGRSAADDLIAAHRVWADWLGAGRVRKVLLVAERQAVAAVARRIASAASCPLAIDVSE